MPFIALTKAISAQLANAQLARVERALEVHERLAHAVLEGRGAPALLAIVGEHVGCSLALVDEAGRVVGERQAARLDTCEHVLDLSVVADGETWSASEPGSRARELSEYDRLVLHHGQTALAFELSRRHAVSAAELRLAGTCSRTSSTTASTSGRSGGGSRRSGSIRGPTTQPCSRSARDGAGRGRAGP